MTFTTPVLILDRSSVRTAIKKWDDLLRKFATSHRPFRTRSCTDRSISVVALLLGFSLASSGCGGGKEAPPPPIPSVKVFDVGRQATGQSRRISGKVQAGDQSTLSFGVNGQVVDVIGEVGLSVVKGQILAKLDADPLRLRLEDARTGVGTARGNLDEVQLEYSRLRNLILEKAATQAEVDAATARLTAADGELKTAKRALSQAEIDFARTQLIAPFGGKIVEVPIDRFQEVTASDPAFVLQAEGALEIEVGVPETFIREVDYGQVVEAQFPSLEGVSVSGVVTQIGAAAGAGTAFPVTVRLSESGADLRPGMTASITFNFSDYLGGRTAYLIPLSAVAIDAGLHASDGKSPDAEGRKADVPVFVLDPVASKIRLQFLKVGDLRGNELEVFSGLELGDKVVSAGTAFLRDGMAAREWIPRGEASQ